MYRGTLRACGMPGLKSSVMEQLLLESPCSSYCWKQQRLSGRLVTDTFGFSEIFPKRKCESDNYFSVKTLNLKRNHFLFNGHCPIVIAFFHPLNLSTFPKALPKKAFACPAAVVSSFFSLARVMAMQQRLRRALALIHLGTMD